MNKVEIAKNIYWVGVVDWNMRTFHGQTYTTKRGTTYNSYLIVDDKITLVDTVLGSFSKELISRIKEVIDPSMIDYIVVNHVETDHSGSLPEVLKLCPKAKLIGSAKCKEGLEKHYYGNWDFQVVKSGDTLKLGKRTLSFIEAPMIHWPDSMFTYIVEDKILMPNDAFGQHYATSQRFDDEVPEPVLMEEASKYYANILWPLSGIISKKIEDLLKTGIDIKTIAPSHGIIWRKDPMKIVNAYNKWARNEPLRRAVIVYETMWGSTAKMARVISEGLIDAGVEVRLYDINASDRTEIINDMLLAKLFLIGSSTHDNRMLSSIDGFLDFLKGLCPKNRAGAAFGSYGWAGGAVKDIEKAFEEMGTPMPVPSLSVRYVPSAEEIKACYAFGRSLSEKI